MSEAGLREVLLKDLLAESRLRGGDAARLRQMPLRLLAAVREYQQDFEGVKILTADIRESRPYRDKAIVETVYCIYVERGNVLSVFRTVGSNRPGYGSDRVYHDSMLAGDVRVFIEESRWFK